MVDVQIEFEEYKEGPSLTEGQRWPNGLRPENLEVRIKAPVDVGEEEPRTLSVDKHFNRGRVDYNYGEYIFQEITQGCDELYEMLRQREIRTDRVRVHMVGGRNLSLFPKLSRVIGELPEQFEV